MPLYSVHTFILSTFTVVVIYQLHIVFRLSLAVLSPMAPSAVSSTVTSSRNATKRLLKEITAWQKEAPNETGIERLGPVGEEDLFHWEAVINGRGVGFGYDGSSDLLFSSLPIYCP